MPSASHPVVFISYSHDSPEHADRVLSLSEHLRRGGIDCRIDQYEEAPTEGWTQWMVNQVRRSEYVLVVCTEAYRRRFEGEETAGQGKGVKWEGLIISQALYEAEGNAKFIPIVFSATDLAHRPFALTNATYYDLSTEAGYNKLYRRLTRQPETPAPPLGAIVPMPIREVKQDFGSSANTAQGINISSLSGDHAPSAPRGKRWLTGGTGSGDSGTKIIGPAGGTIEVNGHVLFVPPGAVTQNTRFTLREAPIPQVMVIVTAQGRFKGKLSLTMSWERCGPGVNPRNPEIYRDFSDNLGGIVRGQTITTDQIDHLSKFMVAQG